MKTHSLRESPPQPSPPQPSPPQPSPPRRSARSRWAAAWLARSALVAAALTGVCAGAFEGTASAQQQEVPISPQAREKFRAGVALLRDPDGARNEEAYLAFKAAYAISPSPNILGNLGLCAMRLERDSEAIEAYSTYLARGTNIDPGERAQIETDLKTLTSTVATLELRVDPPNAMVSDERSGNTGTIKNRYGPVGPSGLRVGMRAGQHRVTVTLDGHQPVTLEIDLQPGRTEARAIKMVKGSGGGGGGSGSGSETERPVPVSVWAMLGVTGALGVGAGVVGGLALANKSEYDDANTGADPQAAEDLKSKGTAMNIATDVLIGTTGAAAAVTLILFLTRPEEKVRRRQPPAAAPRAADSGVDVDVLFGGNSLYLLGKF